MKIKIENYQIEKLAESSSVNFLFDVHLEDGLIGTCNVWLQDIFHQLQFVDEGGNKFLFQPNCQNENSGNLTDNESPEYSDEHYIGSVENISKEELDEPVENGSAVIVPFVIKVEKLDMEFQSNPKKKQSNELNFDSECATLTHFEQDVIETRQANIDIPENIPRKSNPKQSLKRRNRQRKNKLVHCEECGESFTFEKLNLHKETHNNFSIYKCKQKGKSFSKERNLKLHQNIHRGKKTFQCQYCEKSYIGKSGLNYQLNSHIKVLSLSNAMYVESTFQESVTLSDM